MRNGMRHRQHGMTMMGMLCILVMAGFLVYAGIRLVPVYLNYMNLVHTLQAVALDIKGENPDPGAIRTSLARHWEITTISEVEPKDVEITKDDTGVSMHVVYDDSAPYIGNVSLVVHFDKTVKVQ